MDIETKRNKAKLNHNGFLYVFDQLSKDETKKFWRCEYFGTKNVNCHARLHADFQGNVLKEVGAHTCTGSGAENVGKKQVMTALKRRAIDTNEAPAMLRTNVLQNIPTPVLAQLNNKDSMKKVVKRARREIEPPPALPNSLEELVIPERFQMYQRTEELQEQFLLADSGIYNENDRNHRILIFGRSSYANWSGNMKEVFVDGTFSLAPNLFYQIYVVLARKNDWVFPVLYGLLSTKTQSTYERFWRLVKQQWPAFSPESVSVDYEQGAINAIRTEFPEADLRGCLFHLVQNMKKQIAQEHLTQRYRLDANFAIQCRLITSMAFLPLDQITNAINALDLHLPPEMAPLMNWFITYYTGRPRVDGTRTLPQFPPELWNVHQRTLNGDARTNNFAEASHRRLQGAFACHHPTIWNFIDTLKREQKSRDADMALCIRGEPHREKDKNLIKTDRAILTLVQRFNPPNIANQMADHNYQIGLHHYIIEFLTGISSNYKMDP